MLNIQDILRCAFLVFTAINCVLASIPCKLRSYGYNYNVCVCNTTYCDTIDPIIKPETGEYHVFVSNRAGDRFKKSIHKFSPKIANSILNLFNLNVNFQEQFQIILGFGGAFTDSTGMNILTLNQQLGESILKSYFSTDGLEYNVCRVPMGGTDFSTFGYSYLDYKNISSVNEKNYSLVPEDLNFKIPYIKAAQSLSPNLLLFTSTWTAPKSWKTNGAYEGPGQLKPEFYQGWADYFLRFLDLYRHENINFWGITTGNEAFTGFVPTKIPTVAWYPWDIQKWLIENLGPTLRNSDWHKEINIITLDDQKFMIPFLKKMFESDSSKIINGIGTHWYWDEISPSFLLDDFHFAYPDKFILATEACTGAAIYDKHGVILGSWNRGERYALSIIDNLQHWAVGWIDWNMVLDEKGGPTFIDNIVDSPIIVNASAQEFYKQPMFYAMGHFSKFLCRDSVRIGLEDTYLGLKMVAFKRPDSILILIIVNAQPYNIPIRIFVPHKGMMNLIVDQHSLTSLVI